MDFWFPSYPNDKSRKVWVWTLFLDPNWKSGLSPATSTVSVRSIPEYPCTCASMCMCISWNTMWTGLCGPTNNGWLKDLDVTHLCAKFQVHLIVKTLDLWPSKFNVNPTIRSQSYHAKNMGSMTFSGGDNNSVELITRASGGVHCLADTVQYIFT